MADKPYVVKFNLKYSIPLGKTDGTYCANGEKCPLNRACDRYKSQPELLDSLKSHLIKLLNDYGVCSVCCSSSDTDSLYPSFDFICMIDDDDPKEKETEESIDTPPELCSVPEIHNMDIDLIISQTGVNKDIAFESLLRNNADIVASIMDIQEKIGTGENLKLSCKL